MAKTSVYAGNWTWSKIEIKFNDSIKIDNSTRTLNFSISVDDLANPDLACHHSMVDVHLRLGVCERRNISFANPDNDIFIKSPLGGIAFDSLTTESRTSAFCDTLGVR